MINIEQKLHSISTVVSCDHCNSDLALDCLAINLDDAVMCARGRGWYMDIPHLCPICRTLPK